MKKNRFDMEQEIMACWGVTDDIDILAEAVLETDMSEDDLANALIGMKTMYELKFNRLWATYEKLIGNGR